MTTNVVPLRDICKAIKLEPKVARARLRSAKPGQLPKPMKDARWVWSPAKASKVKKFLRAA